MLVILIIILDSRRNPKRDPIHAPPRFSSIPKYPQNKRICRKTQGPPFPGTPNHLNRIESGRSDFPKPVIPVGSRNPEIVNASGNKPERISVQKKGPIVSVLFETIWGHFIEMLG
jgi:hypothetical protein